MDQRFSSQPLFASQHQLDYVMSLVSPISSEIGLRKYERDTVEKAVRNLVDEAYDNLRLRIDLGLQGGNRNIREPHEPRRNRQLFRTHASNVHREGR
ncbi:hypothetical protein CDEST_02034 [Colletotrichum destructivum]|uniref:Uncharacterized protein n=1 Tax=Colletotrichum destructivum TaxID=34406 RepID=A0AAX4I0X7_9PEZI|nr:hypothetical protein CDEST_02034 [Colletotrichum destructivum]